ncbi:uncharacterized protein [Venturia canescens]|uniref:uncharacterized protein n=1 Tax=Venturia canescens TaxID=32260 RepID=UPI001C9BCF80|nr:uncharacterized protein LOC122405883 [Venturia canescens]
MKHSRLLLTSVFELALLFQISTIQASTDVPVLIWGGDTPATSNKILVNPFEKTSQGDFEKIVTKFVGGSLSPLLVFFKEDLCIEDLANSRESLRSLMDTGSLVYRPMVETPISVFEKLPFYNLTTSENLNSLTEGQLNLHKVPNLKEIVKKYNEMKKLSPNLVAALTGASCRFARPDRIKRAVDDDPTPKSSALKINASRILMYASSQPMLEYDETNINVTATKDPVPEGNGSVESPLQVNFEYSVNNGSNTWTVNILLRFLHKYTGYYTPEVLYKLNDENTTLTPSTDASFPFNFSYHCSQSVKYISGGGVKFNLKDFQVQIDAQKFGDAYDCVGFMSIPIWAGIFVTAILAIIMTWGLTMVMDIRTPDRYDDPKGKTITINASVD